jgi:hypothetical protein
MRKGRRPLRNLKLHPLVGGPGTGGNAVSPLWQDRPLIAPASLSIGTLSQGQTHNCAQSRSGDVTRP